MPSVAFACVVGLWLVAVIVAHTNRDQPPMDDLPQLARACRDAGLPPPNLWQQFEPYGRWRLTLAWPDRKVAVALVGRANPYQYAVDMVNEAVALGWRVVMVDAGMSDAAVVDLVKRALSA